MAVTRPTNLQIPFANEGAKNEIPIPSQIGIKSGAASFTDGFPPITRTAITAGGLQPSGMDWNGILNYITKHVLFRNTGGRYRFDATVAAAIGGYDVGMVLQSDDGLNEYVNILAGNTTNFNTSPSSIGVTWLPYAGVGALGLPGMLSLCPTENVPIGCLECNGAAVSRSTYSSLFGKIGTTYGIGNGSTTFNIPDYRGYFLRGWAHGSTIDPDRLTRANRGDGTAGDAVGTKQADAFKLHTHTYVYPKTTGTAYKDRSQLGDSDWPGQFTTYYGDGDTRPINISIMVVIKY
jgi:microcystin-dependent protein